MKYTFHIPTQQYGFVEIEASDSELESALEKYNELAETKIQRAPFVTPTFKEIETWTGEKILYDPINHLYTDLEGNPLISGSEYAKSLEAPFDREKILPLSAKKAGKSVEEMSDIWDLKGQIGRDFGTVLHKSLELYIKHREVPKHPILKAALETNPLKEKTILSEVFVSDVENKRVGQIDVLEISEKTAIIHDWKTDADISKNLQKHFNQLSFYGHILEAHGWTIGSLQVHNYTGQWETFTSELLALK